MTPVVIALATMPPPRMAVVADVQSHSPPVTAVVVCTTPDLSLMAPGFATTCVGWPVTWSSGQLETTMPLSGVMAQ